MLTLQKNAHAKECSSFGAALSKSDKRASAALVALVLFLVAINAMVPLDGIFARPVVSLPRDANIIFAGSSVIATPFVDFENQSWRCHYRETHVYFHCPKAEQIFKNYGLDRANVWCGAVTGQWIEETELFVEHNVFYFGKPRVLVLGIFPCTFRARATTAQCIGVRVLDNLVQCLQTYKKKALDSFCRRNQNRANYLLYKMYEEGFRLHETPKQRWQRVERNYRLAYSYPFDDERLRRLSHIVSICKSRNIKLIVVSTPLAPSNRRLMSRGFYSTYIKQVRTAVGQDTAIVDLGESQSMVEPDDFNDGAHCNEHGAQKIVSALAGPVAALLGSDTAKTSSP